MRRVDSLRDEGMEPFGRRRDVWQAEAERCGALGVPPYWCWWGSREVRKTGEAAYRIEHVLQALTHTLGSSRCCLILLGREQVQKLQHTSVKCLHMYNDSLGHFYVGDGSTY